MARPARTLCVYANPYASLDHEGRPSGVVLLDPVEHHPYGEATVDGVTGEARWEPRRYVGATLDTAATTIVKRAAAQGRGQSGQSDIQDTVWSFSSDPQTLPVTNYYLDRIRDGELLVGDAATAAIVGRAFVPYEKAIASARAHALGLWFRARPDHDVPEWATPDDLADLHEDFSSKEHKEAHACEHAERCKAAELATAAKAKADGAPTAPPAAPTTTTPPTTPTPALATRPKLPSNDTPASEVK